MNTRRAKAGAHGFSLVEVMIALVVICIGLLGIAKMQALAISNTSISRQRSMAAIEAASLASAMHANRLFWGSTASNFQMTWKPTAAPPFQPTTAAAAALATAANAANGHSCDGVAGVAPVCAFAANNTTLAAADLAGWATALSAILPNPTATINCGVTVGTSLPPSCTILIQWGETSVAMSAQEAATESGAPGAAKFEKPKYQLYVEP